jgi:acyl carrier protein
MKTFEKIFEDFFQIEPTEENLAKKPDELNIDSIKLWEFIAILEEKFQIEFEIEEITESKNFLQLKKVLGDKIA